MGRAQVVVMRVVASMVVGERLLLPLVAGRQQSFLLLLIVLEAVGQPSVEHLLVRDVGVGVSDPRSLGHARDESRGLANRSSSPDQVPLHSCGSILLLLLL